MLDENIRKQLQGLFAGLKSEIVFDMKYPRGSDASEMAEFLSEVADASPLLSLVSEEADVEAPVFEIMRFGSPTGVRFCGIPGGHEFSTLVLAVLNADGQGKNLPDEVLAARVKAIKGPVRLRTFVSLSCNNCPDVAQALNVMALLNSGVENTVTDGAVVPATAKALDIQSVPAVYAGDKLISVGRISFGDLLARLEDEFGVADGFNAAPVVHEYDVVVLGGGPAGASAAIYAARKGLSVAVVAKSVGGQVRETMSIENLISVPKTTGPQLAEDLKEHMRHYPIDLFENRIAGRADFSDGRKSIVCGHETFTGKALVIATGAGWRRLSIPGEEDHIGHGVSFCTHCDGPFYAGRRVAVVGGGNSGIEAALDLSAICPHVDVFEFTDSLKADRVLQEKLSRATNVDLHLSTQVTGISGDGRSVSGIVVKDLASGAVMEYPVSGVFIQIGLLPASSLFDGLLPMNEGGEIIVDRLCRTSVKGVYAAGDVTDVPYKQVIVAMGEGARAALSLFSDFMRGVLE